MNRVAEQLGGAQTCRDRHVRVLVALLYAVEHVFFQLVQNGVHGSHGGGLVPQLDLLLLGGKRIKPEQAKAMNECVQSGLKE